MYDCSKNYYNLYVSLAYVLFWKVFEVMSILGMRLLSKVYGKASILTKISFRKNLRKILCCNRQSVYQVVLKLG